LISDDQAKKIIDEMVELFGEFLYGYAEHQPKMLEHYMKLYVHVKSLKKESIL
jgi:hypothetical protein